MKKFYCHICRESVYGTQKKHLGSREHATALAKVNAENAAHQHKTKLREIGRKAAHIRGVTGYMVKMGYTMIDASYQYAEDVATGAIVIDEAELAREVNEKWDIEVSSRAHMECKERFVEYGDQPYGNYHKENLCVICGRPLICAGLKRRHKYNISLSMEECAKRGIYHGGNCYTVYQCIICNDIHAVDSSG